MQKSNAHVKLRQFLTGCRVQSLRGFTLIEVMIVVAILGVLAAIAYPSYTEFILKGRRADGKAGLQRAAQWLEKRATVTGSYSGSNSTNTNASSNTSINTLGGDDLSDDLSKAGLALSEEGRYTITAERINNDQNTFILKARPKQADPKCDAFTLNHQGVKGLESTSSTPETVDYCWNH